MARKNLAERPAPPHFLRAWRDERQLTQEQLAERAETTHGTISRLESGVIKLTQKMALRLARALEIGPGDLFHHPADADSIWAFAHKLASLPPDQRELVAKMIDGLIAEPASNKKA